MTRERKRLLGWILVVTGTLMLIAGIVLMITSDTVFTSVMLTGSILVNTVAISLLRFGKELPK